MTHLYDWYSFPPTVAICCVRCGNRAQFSEDNTDRRPLPNQPIQGFSTCLGCGYHGHHAIHWPQQAYYQTDIRGQVLWAWDAQAVHVLIDYLSAGLRCEKDHLGYCSFLWHVPTHFKRAAVREDAVLKLKRLVSS